jgi:hypothetical protein
MKGGRSRPTATTVILTAAILGPTMADEQQGPERHINIHFEPKHMAGKYANFANVSHSDYEFTLTFARVDHEVEDEEIPGVVVARINLSPRFMRELLDAMEDNYSKWRTRENIKSLPEYDGPPSGEDEE